MTCWARFQAFPPGWPPGPVEGRASSRRGGPPAPPRSASRFPCCDINQTTEVLTCLFLLSRTSGHNGGPARFLLTCTGGNDLALQEVRSGRRPDNLGAAPWPGSPSSAPVDLLWFLQRAHRASPKATGSAPGWALGPSQPSEAGPAGRCRPGSQAPGPLVEGAPGGKGVPAGPGEPRDSLAHQALVLFFLFKNLKQKTKGSHVVLSEVLQVPNKQRKTFQPLRFRFRVLPTTRFWKVPERSRWQCRPPPMRPLAPPAPVSPPPRVDGKPLSAGEKWKQKRPRRGSRASRGARGCRPGFVTLGAWTAGATTFENHSGLTDRKPNSPRGPPEPVAGPRKVIPTWARVAV